MESTDRQYEETLSWLYGQLPMFSRVGAPAYKPGLEMTLSLDEHFDHPHKEFKAIHIAGTNGKGSTSHMTAAALQAQGYKTGLYTSPHLTDFRERMRINGEMIPKERVVRFVEDWRNGTFEGKPSFFELTMMMAFQWFAEQKVDYAVIEVGMGGRLDSTNIITPIATAITNISFDHTAFLGDTLEKIAAEKAGIIKPGIPVVIGEAEGAVKRVFEETAAQRNAPIVFAEDFYRISKFINEGIEGWNCLLTDGEEIDVPLGGEYQKKNIRTVLCLLSELRKSGVKLSDANIKRGLENVTALTGLRGRWQKVNDEPLAICDTGHNIAGLTATIGTLQRQYSGRRLKFVIGFVSDKDVAHIVELFPKDADYYFTRPSIPRGMSVEEVIRYFEKAGISGKCYPDVKQAYGAALADSAPEDVIYVGGSTFIVADLLG